MIRLRPLPPIALTNNQPAFYDVESVSAIQMIAKMYDYLQNMVTDYNAFITEVNNEIESFERCSDKKYDEFTKCVKDLLDNYIESINTKIDLQNNTINNAITNQNETIANSIQEQNNQIQNAVNYMQTNLITTVNNLFNESLQNGDINANLIENYDPNNEALTFTIQGAEEGE